MIKAIIVDDEKRGRDSLQRLLEEYCPAVSIIGQAESVDSAAELISEGQPELVFLDVEMPRGSGFDLLKRFEPAPFRTIFITAHNHYAIKAIRSMASDYLLKPVDVDELMTAVEHVVATIRSERTAPLSTDPAPVLKSGKLAVPVKDGIAFLAPSEIIRLQADGSYTYLFTAAERYTASRNIKEYEDLLSHSTFFRAHNSHLINLEHVKSFSRTEGYFVTMSDGSSVEVSRRRKDDFLRLMNL